MGCSAQQTDIAGGNNVIIGHNAKVSSGVSGSIVIGAGALASVSGEFVVGSSTFPINTSVTAGIDTIYLNVKINNIDYKIPLNSIS